MRTTKEIDRAMRIMVMAVSDVMRQDPLDELKLESMAGVIMALAWARHDGSEPDKKFEAIIEACNSYDAWQARVSSHKHK